MFERSGHDAAVTGVGVEEQRPHFDTVSDASDGAPWTMLSGTSSLGAERLVAATAALQQYRPASLSSLRELGNGLLVGGDGVLKPAAERRADHT